MPQALNDVALFATSGFLNRSFPLGIFDKSSWNWLGDEERSKQGSVENFGNVTVVTERCLGESFLFRGRRKTLKNVNPTITHKLRMIKGSAFFRRIEESGKRSGIELWLF
jgi:hypothetical protein